MEDRARRVESQQSWRAENEGRDTRAGEASDERQGGTLEAQSEDLQKDTARSDHSEKSETITFQTARGDRYVWPFELCRSLDAIKPLLIEIYILRKEEHLVDLISEGRFDIQIGHRGKIVLPSVWPLIVKPSSVLGIRFRYPEPIYHPPLPGERGSRRQSTPDANVRFRDEVDKDEDEWYIRDVAVEEPDQLFRPRYRIASESDASEDDFDSQASSEDESEDGKPDQQEPPEPIRDVVPPTDSEGNKLSFTVDTTHRRALPQAKGHGTDSDGLDTKDAPRAPVETLRITRAMSAETEGRSMVQIHVLPGPENFQLRQSVKMTWYHITLERLDFTRFKNICLDVPHLSDRMKRLTWDLLGKIEKEKVNAYLDGMFIEPGTVLRADERGQTDPQSVIFSCIPYFDLQAPAKKATTGPGDRLFPARTLMQSYYPYEPVRERDAEQAYRKFGNDHSGKIIHVPNFWMMNIGSSVVVTCGRQPLSAEMVKSITTVEEEIKLLGAQDGSKDTLTRVRLTDWDGRVFIFPLDTCRSYFQLEQRAKELRYTACASMYGKPIRLQQTTPRGVMTADPRTWKSIIQRTDVVFIDLATADEKETNGPQDSLSTMTVDSSISVPPFFHWPHGTTDTAVRVNRKVPISVPTYTPGPMSCLEHAEKVMMSEVLEDYETINAVDKTFTSTVYYQGLPEQSYDDLCTRIKSFRSTTVGVKLSEPCSTHHQTIIKNQCTEIAEQATDFFKVVHATIALFVSDVDKSSMLRKVWGAMAVIIERAVEIQHRGAQDLDSDDAWSIRNPVRDSLLLSALPAGADADFVRSVKRCRKCRSIGAFDSQTAAFEHLRKHMKTTPPPGEEVTSSTFRDTSQPAQNPISDAHLKDWVLDMNQHSLEETNEGALKILTLACETARDLFVQAKQLARGVQNEDGQMSPLYKLPHQLIEAFRNICVFYMATERALHHTEETYKEYASLVDERNDDRLPYSKGGLDVLKRFGDSARQSLLISRHELCWQVRSDPPLDVFSHLSVGPEYVCAWLMRRLLVQPLDKRMTVGDMYREYVSTIQFQVNHRPGKRLLRDINLLQEELQVLMQVNTWQTMLIQNYLTVLDDTTYEKDIPARRSMFAYERTLLSTSLDNLDLARQDYIDLVRRCEPLASNTKQSLEINEEDHGKAIMVFTIVTVIFLPLSFVTSYFGMNTSDIRDMDQRQSLFWSVAIPLTVVTVGSCLLVGYNGDELRDSVSEAWRKVTGKQHRSTTARSISVAQRKRAQKLQQGDSNSTLSSGSFADEAEFASPRPEHSYLPLYENEDGIVRRTRSQPVPNVTIYNTTRMDNENIAREDEIVVRNHQGGPRQRSRHDASYPERPRYDVPRMRSRYGAPARHLAACYAGPPPPPIKRYEFEDEEEEYAGRLDGYIWYKKGKRGVRHIRRDEYDKRTRRR